MGGLGKVTIGHGALMGAVKEVMSGVGLKIEKDISNWKFRIGSCLATICVMVIECGRFKWMDLKIISLMEVNGSNQIIDPWMPGLIQDWATISDAARTGEECKEAPPAFKLDYDVEDLRKAREYKNWEENALALLQESEKDLPYQMTVDYSSFKLLLVGDGATGKTTFLKRHLTGEYKDYYAPTTEVELHPLDFRTNHEDHEEIRFYCWDLAGRRDHMGVDEGHRYYVNAECAIIMFDFTSKASYDNIPNWHRDLCRLCKDIPIVLCGNKAESKKRAIKAKNIDFHKKMNLDYYEISAERAQNLEMPFLSLAKILLGKPDLLFEGPVLYPTHVMPNVA